MPFLKVEITIAEDQEVTAFCKENKFTRRALVRTALQNFYLIHANQKQGRLPIFTDRKKIINHNKETTNDESTK